MLWGPKMDVSTPWACKSFFVKLPIVFAESGGKGGFKANKRGPPGFATDAVRATYFSIKCHGLIWGISGMETTSSHKNCLEPFRFIKINGFPPFKERVRSELAKSMVRSSCSNLVQSKSRSRKAGTSLGILPAANRCKRGVASQKAPYRGALVFHNFLYGIING